MNVFQGKMSNGSLSLDIDFHWFSIFDKKLWRLSIAESGSFGFLIVEVTFYGIFINHIKFHGLSFEEKPVSLQCICLITVPLAFPSVKWFWFLFHHWWRQFPWTCFDGTQFRELSINRVQFGWFQIDSIGFHGFFSNRNDIHGSLINETDLQGIFYTNFFFSFMNFPSTGFPLKDVQSVEKAFFLTFFKGSFL